MDAAKTKKTIAPMAAGLVTPRSCPRSAGATAVNSPITAYPANAAIPASMKSVRMSRGMRTNRTCRSGRVLAPTASGIAQMPIAAAATSPR